MTGGQVRVQEEAGGVAPKPASDQGGEKAEAAAGVTASTGKKDLAAIQLINREEFVASALERDEVLYFYSTEGETRMSSFCDKFPFWGTEIELGTKLGFVEGHLSKKYFKTREHFFQYSKCLHVAAGEGAHSEAAAAMANKLLQRTGLEDKRLTNKCSIKGLDVGRKGESDSTTKAAGHPSGVQARGAQRTWTEGSESVHNNSPRAPLRCTSEGCPAHMDGRAKSIQQQKLQGTPLG